VLITAEARERFNVAPEALWPLIADTERINRALGLLPVRYQATEIGGNPVLLGEYRAAGMRLARWIEHPFDWEEPYRHSVRREYLGGPLREAVIGVELTPAGGGAEVRPWIRIDARNVVGAALARRLAAPRWTEGLLRQCRHFEQYLQGKAYTPFPQLAPQGGVANARLQTLADALARAGKPPELVDHLRRHLAAAPDPDVVSMRPFELADRWEADRRAVLALCLHATVVGLLELSWHVLCPNCRVSKARYRRLQAMEPAVHCETCQIDFDVDFGQLAEVRFDPAPAVRQVSGDTFCLAGPWNSPHVLAQTTLAPGDSRTLHARVEPGNHRLRTLRGRSADLRAREGGAPTLAVAVDERDLTPGTADVAAGPVELTVENRGGSEATLMLEDAAWLDTVATGAVVGTVQEFRTLFSADVLAPGLEVRTKRLAFLFTDLAGSTAMYERIGEARAFRLVQDHFQILGDAVAAHNGAVVKTIGDAVMAVFPTGADALDAAVAIQRDIRALDCRGAVDPTALVRVGVHEGPCVAVTLNDRLDYFGTTVNTAARIEHQCRGGEIVASGAVYADAMGADRLAALQVETERFEAMLRGLSEPIELHRVRPRFDAPPEPAAAPTAPAALPTG
jgi:class 3 adenylate cyclase